MPGGSVLRLVRCLTRPAHLMMGGGYLVDRLVFDHDSLCLTVVGFDPELIRLALAACPFMHAGMVLGLLVEKPGGSPFAWAAWLVLHLAAMVAAMVWTAHAFPASHVAALAAMSIAVLLVDMLATSYTGLTSRLSDSRTA